jgi:predicted metal-binding protein
METFNVKTASNDYNVKVYSKFIKKEDVLVQKDLFCKMCKIGCKNYDNKFSCPPFSGNFIELVGNRDGIFVVLFLMDLSKIDSTQYNKLRIANSIMKSRMDKIMRIMESKFDTKFFSTGSCRLCRTCQLKLKKSCKHPDKMRYSLEATGVDCDDLSKKLFNLPLLWFNNGQAPKYTCVIAGLICDSLEVSSVEIELNKLISSL